MNEKRDNIYIYLWEEFNTIYIGRTINPKSRHYTHKHRESERTYQFSSEHGVEHPKMIIIENDLSIDEGIEREKYWIEYYRNNDSYNVLNKLCGGQKGKCVSNLTEEEKKQRQKEYYQKNKEKIKAYKKEYEKKNREKINKRNREWRKNHYIKKSRKIKTEEEKKIYAKKYREEHREEIRLKKKEYYQKNKEKEVAYRKAHQEEIKLKRREYFKKYYQEHKLKN